MSWLIIAIFFALAALILTSSIMVVTAKNIIHAALWLISSFFGVGALYLLMEAEFLAVVQILVYVGAIAILVIIAVMLTPRITTENIRQLNSRWWATLAIVAALFGLLITPTVLFHEWNIVPPTQEGQTIASVQELGEGFMRQYLLPFEIASVLLLAALIGAVIIVFEERASRRRVLTLAEEVALRKRQRQAAAPAAAAVETKPVTQSPAQTSE